MELPTIEGTWHIQNKILSLSGLQCPCYRCVNAVGLGGAPNWYGKKLAKTNRRSKSLAKIWTPCGEEKIITSATPLADLGRALSISHDLCEVARTKTTSERRGGLRNVEDYKGIAVQH